MKQNESKKSKDEFDRNRDTRNLDDAGKMNLRGESQDLPETWNVREWKKSSSEGQETTGDVERGNRDERGFSTQTEQKVVPFSGERNSPDQSRDISSSIAIAEAVLRQVRDMYPHLPKAIEQLRKLVPDEEYPHVLSEVYGTSQRVVALHEAADSDEPSRLDKAA